MPFKKKKPVEELAAPLPPAPPTARFGGNPGGVIEKAPSAPEAPSAPAITEEVIMGYGLMRVVEELQGLRQEQLGILAILEEIKRQE